ncbi:MAG: DUF3732 domain-containing protein [Nitrosopumilaceae archaeon]
MQILQVILYGYNNKVRTLSFKLGSVNIITGNSATGKSAILEIVDYCLGKSECSVPAGVIRDSVRWFGIVLQLKNSQMFIARKNPPAGSTSSEVYIEEAKEIRIPSSPMPSNSNVDALIETLSNKVGISPNLYIPPRGQTREKLSATIRHTTFFCFQKQDEIATNRYLFHRQADGFIAQSIKDSLEYFLGAIREDRLALLQKLTLEKRNLSKAERELVEAEAIRGEGISKAVGLIIQAKEVGLASQEVNTQTPEEYLKVLQNISKWRPRDLKVPKANLLEKLQDDLLTLKEELRRKNEEINSAVTFSQEAEGFTDEIQYQEHRLESIGLFDEHSESDCPMCSQPIKERSDKAKEIQKMIHELKNNLEGSLRTRSNIRDYIAKSDEEAESIRKKIDEKTIEISSLIQEHESSSKLRDENIRQSQIIGKIKFWLESVALTDETSELRLAVEKAKKKVKELESLISDEERIMRLTRILNIIGRQMSIWTEELELEHSGYPVYFDIHKLTVGVEKDEQYIPLIEMGSGENWLGYHIIVNFALHLYFHRHNRPVPSFLFLDQPSQVYFPPDLADESKGSIAKLKDRDRDAIKRIYNFIFKVTESMAPNFQVIVTDHAKLDDPKFLKSIREEWRDGKALIPQDWQ